MPMHVSKTGQNVLPEPHTPLRGQGTKDKITQSPVPQETVSLKGETADMVTYAKPRILPENLVAMLEEANRKAQEMVDLIQSLISQQGLTLAKVASGEQQLATDPETIEAAKAAIGEEGEWGVKKVSERILGFARVAMGSDPAQLQKIRDAVVLGFAQAKETMGGVLPDISQQTFDSIMTELDRWAQDGIPTGETVTLGRKGDPSGQAEAK